MTRKPGLQPPALIKQWIRSNMMEARGAFMAIERALPFASETADKVALLRIQNAMRVLVAESQVIGLDGMKRSQVVKAG